MKVIFATGGSGGHLYPALDVAQELKKLSYEILFVGAFKFGARQIDQAGFKYESLEAKGFSFKGLKAIMGSLSNTFQACGQAHRILKRERPNVVIGFGGYGSFPVCLAAWFLRIPTVIHEQNVVPGRANSLLSKVVKKIAISFPKSTKYFRKSKTVLTGCPSHVHPSQMNRKDILDYFNLIDGKVTIFVFGGSQGSHRINREFAKLLGSLTEQMNYQVIHVCGEKDYDDLKRQYEEAHVPYALYRYLDDIDKAYFIADLVIARSGAVTVTEIALFKKPAILIPYPHANSHQKENALVLCDAKVAMMIEEAQLNSESFEQAVLEMVTYRPNADFIDQSLNKLFVEDSAKRVAEAIVGIAK